MEEVFVYVRSAVHGVIHAAICPSWALCALCPTNMHLYHGTIPAGIFGSHNQRGLPSHKRFTIGLKYFLPTMMPSGCTSTPTTISKYDKCETHSPVFVELFLQLHKLVRRLVFTNSSKVPFYLKCQTLKLNAVLSYRGGDTWLPSARRIRALHACQVMCPLVQKSTMPDRNGWINLYPLFISATHKWLALPQNALEHILHKSTAFNLTYCTIAITMRVPQ